jgi:hypothetical protein
MLLTNVAEAFCGFILKMENVFAEAIINKPAQTQH